MVSDSSRIKLSEQEISPSGGTFKKVERKTSEIPLVLDKKPSTEIYSDEEKERIRLEKLELQSKFRKVDITISPLSLPKAQLKDNADSKKSNLLAQDFSSRKISLEEKRLLAQGEEIPMDTQPMSTLDLIKRSISMKISAMKALADVNEPHAKVVLKSALDKGEGVQKQAAAEALAKMGDTEGLRILKEGLRKETMDAKIEAIKAISRIGAQKAIPELQEMLSDQNKHIGREAAFALAKTGDRKGIEEVKKLLESENINVKVEAAVTLVKVKDADAVPILKDAIKNIDPSLRYKAAKALGETEDKSVIPALDKLARKDKDLKVRLSASESILKISKKEID